MAALAETLGIPPQIEIQKLKPSQIDLKSAVRLGLDELIPQGYGFEGVGANAGARAMSEFDEKDERSSIYLAMHEGRAVGSIVATAWTPEDEYGKKFWSELKQRDRNLHKRLLKLSPVGLNISGITTHPDFRRQGLTEKMYKRIIIESNPSFVTGITKTPEAVLARANNLRRLGYRTFYGNTEVTPDRADFYTNVHEDLLDADVKARWDSLEETLDGSDVYYISGWLSKAVPDVSSFSAYIQKAFERVIEAQRAANERGDKKVAIKTLISVRSSIRLRTPDPQEADPEVNSEQLPLLDPQEIAIKE